MKALIQRVNKASVEVNKETIGSINKGILVFLGITHKDTTKEADELINKIIKLRIFEDSNSKMNLSVQDIKGELLIISQFTLYADTMHGNRPSFIEAADAQKAEELYNYFLDKLKATNIKTESGIFGAHMNVKLINDGPVTIMLER